MLVLGDLVFKVVDKDFYCRHCDRYTPYCSRNHRSGLWFKVTVRNRNTSKAVTVIFGEGEREYGFPFDADVGKLLYSGMSGCEDYEKGYITCGGWFGLKGILTDHEEDTNIEPEMNEHEKIAFARMLNDYAKEILRTLIDNDVTTTSDDWGLWNCYKPLFKVYTRSKILDMPLDATIREEPKSFKAKFIFGNIEVSIPKGRYKIQREFTLFADTPLIYSVSVGQTKLYYSEYYGRKIVYLTKEHWNYYLAWEQYKDHIHPTAMISKNFMPYEIYRLVKYRLGDIYFIQSGYTEPATKEQFRKIKCLKGCIEFGDRIVVRGDEGIALYHPEHGLLELEAGEYIAYEVPYLLRGHD